MNSVANRKPVDLTGYREHCIQKGIKQQDYLID